LKTIADDAGKCSTQRLFPTKIRMPINSLSHLICLALLLPSTAFAQSTFTGSGNWLDDGFWDLGIPGDGSTATVNGECIINENIVAAQTLNPSRVNIGDTASGKLTVSGGTLSGAHGGAAGIWVGLNGGNGTLEVNRGATYRSQGASMRLAVGDNFGGRGTVIVSGELQIYKFMEIINGTLQMMPAGICNKFNSNNPSVVGANGTLSYMIDGPDVGTISRSNTIGVQLTLDPLANLEITLTGDFAINDSWVILNYTVLSGQFAQGISFVNQQGYSLDINYGSGSNDVVRVTLVSDEDRPIINTFTANPDSLSQGQASSLAWTAGNFETLTLNPGEMDVSTLTTIDVTPSQTTTYTLSAELDGVVVTREATVVVDELPVINSFTVSDELIAPAENTTLAWDVSGADTVSIVPLPGVAAATGTTVVSPTETTEYTLTAANGSGSVEASLVITVDAIDSALVNRFDPALPGQTGGALLDGIGATNIDMTGGRLDTAITTPNTVFTAAIDRVNQDANTGGDAGDGFPVMPASFEVWVSIALLDERPQVIFETGSPGDGTSLLINQSDIRLLHSTGGVTTIDISLPTSQLNATADAVQITATLDSANSRANLYAKGAGGGDINIGADGALGSSIERASLFVWSGFGGSAAGALGGTAAGIPGDVTSFKGSIHLLNIYDRALSAAEVQDAFERKVVEVPQGDNDLDGLPDFWELAFFPDTAGQNSTDNGDGDGLDNAAELIAGTDPTKADTDGDTLSDDAELDSVPATDPNKADTDGDLLTDGEEVNGNPASNPTLVDSDQDGFWDVFEIAAGSNPTNAASLPPADVVAMPDGSRHVAESFTSMESLFPGADTEDASFRLWADFSEKPDGQREVIFETGGATVGLSLVYEAGSELVLRAAGDGGNTIATIRYALSVADLAAGPLDIIFSYQVEDENLLSKIFLFVDGAEAGSESAALGGDWTGSNGATFGAASANLAAAGANEALTGIAPVNVAIDFRWGLAFYRGALFKGGGPGNMPLEIITITRNTDTNIEIVWNTRPGFIYAVDRALSQGAFNWQELDDGTIGTGATASFSDSNVPPGSRTVFYRVRVIE
jgi:hypothetical protein